MKRTLIVLALFVATCVNAQKYELGFNGGINYTTTVQDLQSYPKISGQSATPLSNPLTLSLKLLKNHKNWQYGLSIERSEAEYRTFEYSDILPFYYWPNQPNPYSLRVVSASYYPVKMLVNRKFKTGNYESYAGLSAGYVFLPPITYANKEQAMPFNKDHYYGLTGGLQVGTTRYFTRHIGVNAELDANYLRFSQRSESQLSFYTYSVNLGVRYRI